MKRKHISNAELKKKFLKLQSLGVYNITTTAEVLGISRKTAHQWKKQIPQLIQEFKLHQKNNIKEQLTKEADNIVKALETKNGLLKAKKIIKNTIIQTLVNNL